MSQAVADKVRHLPCIVVNTTHRLAPWAWALYAADEEWWAHPNNADARSFDGLHVTVGDVRGAQRLRHTGESGFDTNPQCLRTGRNSGYQALHLAAHTGAARILLLGFDFHQRGGCHWHGRHPSGLRETAAESLATWARLFDTLVQPLADAGVQVLNCTPGSAITALPFADLDDACR